VPRWGAWTCSRRRCSQLAGRCLFQEHVERRRRRPRRRRAPAPHQSSHGAHAKHVIPSGGETGPPRIGPARLVAVHAAEDVGAALYARATEALVDERQRGPHHDDVDLHDLLHLLHLNVDTSTVMSSTSSSTGSTSSTPTSISSTPPPRPPVRPPRSVCRFSRFPTPYSARCLNRTERPSETTLFARLTNRRASLPARVREG
jgi:hypothetical protein